MTLHVPGRAHMLWAKAKEKRINLRFVDADHLGISFDQSTRRQEVMKLLLGVQVGCRKTRRH